MKQLIAAVQRLLAGISQAFSEAETRRREHYLAQATDLVDLEMRQRELTRPTGSLTAYDYYARG